MHKTYNHIYLALFFLATVRSLEISNEASSSKNKVGDEMEDKIHKLIEETVSENNTLRKRIGELEVSQLGLEKKLQEIAEFNENSRSWQAKIKELRKKCEEEKDQLLSADDKLEKERYKEVLTKCNHKILEAEAKMYGFEDQAKENEYQLMQCQKNSAAKSNEDSGFDSYLSPSKKALEEIVYLVKDFKIDEHSPTSKEEKIALRLLKLVKERLDLRNQEEEDQDSIVIGQSQ